LRRATKFPRQIPEIRHNKIRLLSERIERFAGTLHECRLAAGSHRAGDVPCVGGNQKDVARADA
jgi:hypothetical protein